MHARTINPRHAAGPEHSRHSPRRCSRWSCRCTGSSARRGCRTGTTRTSHTARLWEATAGACVAPSPGPCHRHRAARRPIHRCSRTPGRGPTSAPAMRPHPWAQHPLTDGGPQSATQGRSRRHSIHALVVCERHCEPGRKESRLDAACGDGLPQGSTGAPWEGPPAARHAWSA